MSRILKSNDSLVERKYKRIVCGWWLVEAASPGPSWSDWTGWFCTPVAHYVIISVVNRFNQPFPQALRKRSPAWQQGEPLLWPHCLRPYNKPVYFTVAFRHDTMCLLLRRSQEIKHLGAWGRARLFKPAIVHARTHTHTHTQINSVCVCAQTLSLYLHFSIIVQ